MLLGRIKTSGENLGVRAAALDKICAEQYFEVINSPPTLRSLLQDGCHLCVAHKKRKRGVDSGDRGAFDYQYPAIALQIGCQRDVAEAVRVAATAGVFSGRG